MKAQFSQEALNHLAGHLVPVIRAAGDLIMDVYSSDFSVEFKDDASPVTEADERAEALILPALRELAPGVPIVAEEAMAAGDSPKVTDSFWLVDPLDGTKEFISKNGEFTVNIALIDAGHPVLGLVYAPAHNRLFVGIEGQGAYLEDAAGKRAITTRKPPAEGLTVVASRSHGDAAVLEAFLAGHKIAKQVCVGSSLKLCMIAAGEADVYPRMGRTMEWDIAAGHAVLAAAGGSLTELDGSPFQYGKAKFANPHFVAWGQSVL